MFYSVRKAELTRKSARVTNPHQRQIGWTIPVQGITVWCPRNVKLDKHQKALLANDYKKRIHLWEDIFENHLILVIDVSTFVCFGWISSFMSGLRILDSEVNTSHLLIGAILLSLAGLLTLGCVGALCALPILNRRADRFNKRILSATIPGVIADDGKFDGVETDIRFAMLWQFVEMSDVMRTEKSPEASTVSDIDYLISSYLSNTKYLAKAITAARESQDDNSKTLQEAEAHLLQHAELCASQLKSIIEEEDARIETLLKADQVIRQTVRDAQLRAAVGVSPFL